MSWKVTRLEDVEPLPGPGTLRWLPVRHELGIGAFGTNAYVAENAGDDVVEPHTEEGTGHEELYFVARGAATFTLDGETVHAPAGTYVFLPDPTTQRHATADEPGTTVLSFGGWRDRAFVVSGWESRFRAIAPQVSRGVEWRSGVGLPTRDSPMSRPTPSATPTPSTIPTDGGSSRSGRPGWIHRRGRCSTSAGSRGPTARQA